MAPNACQRQSQNPYPGLRPFEQEDAPFFFGRQQQILELRERLRDQHVVTIIGGSGSGKSSIVRAGLLPSLSGVDLGGTGRLWRPVVFTPGKSKNVAEGRSRSCLWRVRSIRSWKHQPTARIG